MRPNFRGSYVVSNLSISKLTIFRLSRVTALLEYKNEPDHVYSLSCLPIADLAWGGSENASANKLCIRGHDMPVTVWITALIGRLYMFEPSGSPKKKVSVALAPLTEHSLHTSFKVLHDFSKPQERESFSGLYCLAHVSTYPFSYRHGAPPYICVALAIKAASSTTRDGGTFLL